MIHYFEALGKWSLLELYLIVLVDVLFQIGFGVPQTDILEGEEILRFAVTVPLPNNAYLFANAVIVLLLGSNVLLYLHEKLEHDSKLQLSKLTMDQPPAFILSSRGRKTVYVLEFLGFVLFSCILLVPCFQIEFLGLTAFLIEIDGQGVVNDYSIAQVAKVIFDYAWKEKSIPIYVFGTTFAFTVIIAPLLTLLNPMLDVTKNKLTTNNFSSVEDVENNICCLECT